MRLSVVAKSLLILGALVGGLTALALALGLRADHFPPWMITVGMYKLALIAAGGLFVAGAVLGRAARRGASLEERTPDDPGTRRPLVGPGSWNADHESARQPDHVDRDRRHNST